MVKTERTTTFDTLKMLFHDNTTILFGPLPTTKYVQLNTTNKPILNQTTTTGDTHGPGFGIKFLLSNQQIISPTDAMNLTLNLTMPQHQQNSSQTEYTCSDWFPLVMISLLIVISNGLICYLYYRNRSIRDSPANILLLNQSCIDLFSGISYVPAFIVSSYWPKLDALRSTLYMYTFSLSLFGLLALAIDRLWSVFKPLHHRSFFSSSVVLITIFITWFLPLPIVLANLLWASGNANHAAYPTYLWTFISLVLIISFVTLLMYIMTFYQIGRILRGTSKDARSLSRQGVINIGGTDETQRKSFVKKELKLTQLASALFLLYIFGYYPTLCINVIMYIRTEESITAGLQKFAIYSYVLNGIIDPILCLHMKQDYKQALRSLLH